MTLLDYFGIVLVALSAVGVAIDIREHRRLQRARLDISEAWRRR